MRLHLKIAILAASALAICADPVAAETFEDRWSIIPKATAEPSQPPEQLKSDPPAPAPSLVEKGARSGLGQRSGTKKVFSGKASYYSYPSGKTASGSRFN